MKKAKKALYILLILSLSYLFTNYSYNGIVTCLNIRKYNKLRNESSFIKIDCNLENEQGNYNSTKLFFYARNYKTPFFYLKSIDLQKEKVIMEYDNYKIEKGDTTIYIQKKFIANYPSAIVLDSVKTTISIKVKKLELYGYSSNVLIEDSDINQLAENTAFNIEYAFGELCNVLGSGSE